MKRLSKEKCWCVWRRERTRDGKWTKIPYRVNGEKARSNDPATWTDYPSAREALDNPFGNFAGPGIFFHGDLCGIDVDGDHDTGEGNPLEKEVLELFKGTYAEKSPSGTGVHIIFRVDKELVPREPAKNPDGRIVYRLDSRYYMKNPGNGLECYLGGLTNRFFTVSGNRVSEGEDVTDQTEAFLVFLEKYMIRPQAPDAAPRPPGADPPFPEAGGGSEEIDVDARVNMARRAANGERFRRLYDDGDVSEYKGDDSSADLALCDHLAFWLDKKPALIDEAFRKSALYRAKWDEPRPGGTYGSVTIMKAISAVRNVYRGGSLKYRPGDLTDAGNAEVFSAIYGGTLRWCDALGWLVWDGRVWNADDHAAEALALEFSKGMLAESEAVVIKSSTTGDEDDPAAKAYQRHAVKSRSANAIRNFMHLSKAWLSIPAAELDADPYVLNTTAGIVDLRSGETGPHDPGAFCTKIAPFPPSDEGAEKWEAFLDLVTVGDGGLKLFLRRVAGMSVVGAVKNEGVQIAYGGGRNGKSTYFNTLQNVLGGYAGSLDADTLTTEKNNKGASLATLRGRRLVVCGELEEGQRLSVKQLKRIAATDRLVIEAKYRDPETIRPSHHVCMFTNHLPRVGSTDGGTWRRLTVIPFNAVMPDGDREIKDYAEVLAREAGGAVLKWIIDGAREYLADGCRLRAPAAVRKITERYREREDWLTPFVNERCERDAGAETGANDLYNAYRNFAQERGDYVRRGSEFKEALARLGFKNVNKSNRSFWRGIRVSYAWTGAPQTTAEIDDSDWKSGYLRKDEYEDEIEELGLT